MLSTLFHIIRQLYPDSSSDCVIKSVWTKTCESTLAVQLPMLLPKHESHWFCALQNTISTDSNRKQESIPVGSVPTAHLPTIPALVATNCQYRGEGVLK